ncbi:MAG: radical SAM protein [Clostridia bacterium]|nr:radical SAM protein [Clostridia bacterium]
MTGKRGRDPAFPFELAQCVWEITLACCFECAYCGSRAGKARQGELTTEECLDVADQLAELGCERVSMIGGEVFMRRDWRQIASKLTSLGIAVNIITNGFIFNEKMLGCLRDCAVESVSVSIDGPRAIHDRYRQAGSYDRAMAAVRALKEGGIPVSVISTLNSENSKALGELYDALRDTGIFAWQIQACSPMGSASSGGIDYRFDTKSVIKFVDALAGEAPFAVGVADNIGYFTPEEGRIRGNTSGKAYYPGCSAGISTVGIDSVGNVRGCESMYDEFFNEGNLRERTLRDIWEDPEGFAYNRGFRASMLTGACAECRYGEYCAGGCRSYNYFVHRKMYEAPACARNA